MKSCLWGQSVVLLLLLVCFGDMYIVVSESELSYRYRIVVFVFVAVAIFIL